MAADTAIKRLSAMNIGMPWRGTAVVPSGTVDAGERAAGIQLYSGITGAVQVGYTAAAGSPDAIGRALWQRPYLIWITLTLVHTLVHTL